MTNGQEGARPPSWPFRARRATSILVAVAGPPSPERVEASRRLRDAGHRVIFVDALGDVTMDIERHRCQLVILVGAPPVEAYGLLDSPGSSLQCPLLVLYTEATPDQVVRTLDAGADDVMLAPVSSAEFLARVAVAIRYSEALGALASRDVLELPGFRIDLVAQTAELGGTSIPIPGYEFELLSMLARNLGTVLPTQMLLEQIWPDGSAARASSLRVCAFRLRKRLRGQPNAPVIVAKRGVGYAMYLRTAEA